MVLMAQYMSNLPADFPTNLQHAIVYFGNPENAFRAAIALRWPDGIVCPRCGCREHSFISTRKKWFCKGCKKQFTVKVGSVFEDGTGGKDKTAVLGILERGGKVRTKIVDKTKKTTLQREVREHVLAGSALFTDALKSYDGLDEFQHEVVDHAVEYVRGEVHTDRLENFWSLLKRGLHGTYVSVEPFHLFRYIDEQAYRYNNRKGLNDADRFVDVMRNTSGKRLTWKTLTGKTEQPSSELA